MLQRFIVLTLLLVASAFAEAQISPAMLGDLEAEKNWLNLIEWPETHGDATVPLECVAIVKANGRTFVEICVSSRLKIQIYFENHTVRWLYTFNLVSAGRLVEHILIYLLFVYAFIHIIFVFLCCLCRSVF